MKAGEICNRSVVIVREEESALVAARLMREHDVGDVVIVSVTEVGNIPIGIVTDRDITIELIAEEVDLDAVNVGEFFIGPTLVTVGPEDDMFEVIEEMKKSGVRRIPVVEANGTLAGIITADDVLCRIAEEFNLMAQLLVKQNTC